MDNATMMYIVIGLLVIFFIVLLIFSAKTWRILHLVSITFVFLAAGFFVWVSAATLRTQTAWRGALNKLDDKIEAADKQIELLREGDQKAEDLEDSVRELDAELTKVLLDRPSVWRGCLPEVSGNQVRLTIPATAAPAPAEAGGEDAAEGGEVPAEGEEPAEGEAPVAPGGRHNLKPGMIVYGFVEGESQLSGDLKGHMVPQLYLGEYKVVSSDDTSLILEPTIELTAVQEGNREAGTWTIYDNMPTDSTHAFAGLSEEDLKILFPIDRTGLSPPEYDARIDTLYEFFAGLDPASFPDGIVPASPDALARKVPMDSVGMDDAEYAAFIGQYMRDGQKYDEKQDPPEPPDRIWKKVKFKTPASIQVDAVLQDLNALESDDNFRSNVAVAIRRETGEVLIGDQSLIQSKPADENLGQVNLGISVNDPLKLKSDWEIVELWDSGVTPPKLKQLSELTPDELEAVRDAKSVAFEIDEEAIVDPTTAQFLIEKNIAQEVEPVFVRQLRDYKTYFRDSNQQELFFQDNALVLLQDTVTLVEAGQRAKEQETFRSEEIAKLREDRAGFEREVAAITAVLTKVETHRAAMNERLSQLYNHNVLLARKIFKLQLEQAAEIERRQKMEEEASGPAASDAALSSP